LGYGEKSSRRGKEILKIENDAWWMVGGMFLILTLSSGFGFYNMSVYMNALAAKPEGGQHHWDQKEVAHDPFDGVPQHIDFVYVVVSKYNDHPYDE
jgi:hypothetical protein